jgi:hypothetical protein
MLPSLSEYESLIYGLPDRYSSIKQSTLVIIRQGPAFAELSGTVEFEGNVTLTAWEDLDFAHGVIQGYSYSVSQEGRRLYWYDPQPHPDDSSLASTFPHHKHVPPDIKRHRVPAPDLAFDRPNLPKLIEKIERDLLSSR